MILNLFHPKINFKNRTSLCSFNRLRREKQQMGSCQVALFSSWSLFELWKTWGGYRSWLLLLSSSSGTAEDVIFHGYKRYARWRNNSGYVAARWEVWSYYHGFVGWGQKWHKTHRGSSTNSLVYCSAPPFIGASHFPHLHVWLIEVLMPPTSLASGTSAFRAEWGWLGSHV